MGCLCDKEVVEEKKVPLTPPPLGWTCVICMDEDVVDYLQAPECGHTFHSGCLQAWSRRRNACPMCEARIY